VGVEGAALAGRRDGWQAPPLKHRTGVLGKYARLVGSAAEGAVVGFS